MDRGGTGSNGEASGSQSPSEHHQRHSITDNYLNVIRDAATGEPSGSGNATNNNNNNNNNLNNNDDQSSMGSIHLNPEAQRLLNTLKKYVPLLMLILIKAVYDHGAGIFYFTLLLITFIQSNNDLKKEIAKQQNRSWIALCGIFCYILACIFCVTVIFTLLINQISLFLLNMAKT